MNIAMYINYGYYLNTQAALAKLKEQGIKHIVTWVGHDIEQSTTVTEHELYSFVRDNDLTVDAALVPNDHLPYLSNTMYGRKDAVKAYKQYVLTAADQRIPLLVMDAAPTTAPLVEALREICDYAAEQGIMVAIRDGKNVDTVGLLSAVDNLYYCLDTAACLKNEINVAERLQSVGSRLLFVLLSDPAVDGSLYLPTYGNTDFAPVFAAIKATGYVGAYGLRATQGKGLADADALLAAAKKLQA